MSKVRTQLVHAAGLTTDQAESLSFGQAHWWLRQHGGDFVKLPKRVRGDKDLDLAVELEPGEYMLGVGPARQGVRLDIEVVAEAPVEVSGGDSAAVDGKRFVFTGDLDCMDRDSLKALLQGLGAKVTGSVSGKTDYLVIGHEPGAKKIEKANQLGTTQLDEAGFIALVGLEVKEAAPDEEDSPVQQKAKRYFQRISLTDKERAAVEKVATPQHFDDMGESGRELWGIAIGPRGGRYEVHADLGNRNPRWGLSCNCSSSKRPCRHAAALVLTAATHWIPPAPPPDGHRERAQDRFSFME